MIERIPWHESLYRSQTPACYSIDVRLCYATQGKQRQDKICSRSALVLSSWLNITPTSNIVDIYWLTLSSFCWWKKISIHPSIHASVRPSVRPSVRLSVPEWVCSFLILFYLAFIIILYWCLVANWQQCTIETVTICGVSMYTVGNAANSLLLS